jgi:hypothetical protein
VTGEPGSTSGCKTPSKSRKTTRIFATLILQASAPFANGFWDLEILFGWPEASEFLPSNANAGCVHAVCASQLSVVASSGIGARMKFAHPDISLNPALKGFCRIGQVTPMTYAVWS